IYEAYQKDEFAHVTYIEVTGMGHTTPSAEWYEKGIDALDAPLESPSQLHERATSLDNQKKPGEAYFAYARAAARGGDADFVKEAGPKADAIYKDYSGQVARVVPPAQVGAADK